MLRLIYVIMLNILRIVYFVPKMSYYARHTGKYSDRERYALAQRLVSTVMRTSRVETEHIGAEKLPRGCGYMMFSNHQGRYDPIGILSGHELPCSFLLEKKRAEGFLSGQFSQLIDGIGIDRESIKDQMRALRTLCQRVKEGKRYVVFPEGKYCKDQGNRTSEFKEGCFLAAVHAKCPIVPVTVVDSYKVYGENSLRRICTKVIYHDPIYYEDYSGMKPAEISALVKSVIDGELSKYEK